MTETPKAIDRTDWGVGPWASEPDRLEWRSAAGPPCLMVRNYAGIWCGYAAVPPGHPWYGKDYDDLRVEVHGGLTYGHVCRGDICHEPAPGEPDDVYWLGFDCHHAGDFAPMDNVYAKRYRYREPWNRYPYDHERAVRANRFDVDQYRTVVYVQAECETLAQQIVAAQPVPVVPGQRRIDLEA